MYVAFASTDGKVVDSHFALSPSFFIYQVTEHNSQMSRMVYPQQPEKGEEYEESKVENVVKSLEGCAIVYCTNIGGPAAARLVQHKIHPIKAEPGTSIQAELVRLNTLLQTNPPPWLKKINALENAK